MVDTTTLQLADIAAAGGVAKLLGLLANDAHVVVNADAGARLPVRLLASVVEATKNSKGFLRCEGLSPAAQAAIAVVDQDRRIAVGGTRPTVAMGDRPYVVQPTAEGGLVILLLKGVGQHPHMNDAAAYEWIRGLEATSVTIDLVNIEHLNSLLVAWMLQINQGVAPSRCRLANVSRQAAAQLTQLRLNHLLTII